MRDIKHGTKTEQGRMFHMDSDRGSQCREPLTMPPNSLRRSVRGGEFTSVMDDTGPQEDHMATVISRSADELRQEREHLLRRAGLSESELRDRAETYQLTAEQMTYSMRSRMSISAQRLISTRTDQELHPSGRDVRQRPHAYRTRCSRKGMPTFEAVSTKAANAGRDAC